MKTAILLGASGGLGREITRELINGGFKVIGTYHQHLPSDNLGFSHDVLTLVPLDLQNEESLENFINSLATIGTIDFFLSTIANILSFEKFEKTPLSTFENDLRLNFLAHIQVIQSLLPRFTTHSNIIFILTEMVERPQKYYSSYISSKYALYGLMKCLAVEFEPRGIRVNAISPSGMDTNFRWRMRTNNKDTEFPAYMKSSILKEHSLIPPNKVSKAVMGIITDGTSNGKNLIIT